MNNWNFNFKHSKDFSYFTIPSFEKYNNIRHCFATRLGGVSTKPYESLNLGRYTTDKIENVRKNYAIVCKNMGINIKDLVFTHQVHKDNIVIIDENFKKQEDSFSNVIEDTDALITNKKGICLVTVHADCTPIFIFDCKKNIVALAHAGWRGTVKKIGKKTVETMKKHFKSDPKDCLVGIGPSIGSCCYEVDEPVIDEFKAQFRSIDDFARQKSNSKYMLDLWTANKISIMEAGVPSNNITISNICTMCNKNIFFSHRGENGITGRMASFIEITNG